MRADGARCGVAAVVSSLALLTLSCAPRPRFPEGLDFAGRHASAALLEQGRHGYDQYCRACHGATGMGDGPAARGMNPPPRDFTVAQIKFGWVVDGLPPDTELARIVRDGLHGTAMRPWRVPERSLEAILQHVKSFDPEAWREPLGRPVVPPPDPFASGDAGEALARGSLVYHGLAQCHSCHPAYVPRDEVLAARAVFVAGGAAAADVRQDLHHSTLERSEYRSAGAAVMIVSPDFTSTPLRSARDASRREDLYRVIAAGIPGTAMPTWEEALAPADLWALARYVDWLADLRGRPEASALREGLSRDAERRESRTPPDAAPAPPAAP